MADNDASLKHRDRSLMNWSLNRLPAAAEGSLRRLLLAGCVAIAGVEAVAWMELQLLRHEVSPEVVGASAFAILVAASTLAAVLAGRRAALLAGFVATVVFVAVFRMIPPADPSGFPPALVLAVGGLFLVCMPGLSPVAQSSRFVGVALCWLFLNLAGQQQWGSPAIRSQVAVFLVAVAVIAPAAVWGGQRTTLVTSRSPVGNQPHREVDRQV
jgi:hypothetical protein